MPEEYQVGMLISAASDQTLIVINALPYATSSDRQKLSKVIQLLFFFLPVYVLQGWPDS